MIPRAVLVVDVAFEDVLNDFLSLMRVHLAFPSGSRHALRKALEREEGLLVAGREQEMGRRVGAVNLPMDYRQVPRLSGWWHGTLSTFRQRLEKGQASVGYRFSVVAASRKRAVRVVRIVGRPMRPEPRPNHGHRDPTEDEAERFESEIREIAELGPGLSGRTGREKDHRRGPQNERCENFGFQATRSDVTRHFLRSRFIEDGVFPRFLVLPVHMEVGREEQRHDDPGHQEEARSSKEETGYGGEDQVGECAHREEDEEQANTSPPSLETKGHGIRMNLDAQRPSDGKPVVPLTDAR